MCFTLGMGVLLLCCASCNLKVPTQWTPPSSDGPVLLDSDFHRLWCSAAAASGAAMILNDIHQILLAMLGESTRCSMGWKEQRCRPAHLRGPCRGGFSGRPALLLPGAPGRGRSAAPAAVLYEAEQLLDGALVLPPLLLRRQRGRGAVRDQLPLLVPPLLQLLRATPT